MPSRTYTGVDLINVVRDLNTTGNVDAIAFESGNINTVLSANGSDSFLDQGGVSSDVLATYNLIANLDFSLFPTIPAGAIISRVEVKIDTVISGTANSAAGGPWAGTIAGGSASVKAFRDIDEMIDVRTEDTAGDPGNGSASATLSATNHYTQEQVFDYSLAPITKAEFEALFVNLQFVIECSFGSSATQIID